MVNAAVLRKQACGRARGPLSLALPFIGSPAMQCIDESLSLKIQHPSLGVVGAASTPLRTPCAKLVTRSCMDSGVIPAAQCTVICQAPQVPIPRNVRRGTTIYVKSASVVEITSRHRVAAVR